MANNDNFGLDFDLGETAEMIRDTVSTFAQAEIAPRAAEIDKSNTFPRDLWPRMGELGLHGITVEEEFGGLGLGCAFLRRPFQSVHQPDPPQWLGRAEAALSAEADFRRACRRARHVGARL